MICIPNCFRAQFIIEKYQKFLSDDDARYFCFLCAISHFPLPLLWNKRLMLQKIDREECFKIHHNHVHIPMSIAWNEKEKKQLWRLILKHLPDHFHQAQTSYLWRVLCYLSFNSSTRVYSEKIELHQIGPNHKSFRFFYRALQVPCSE